MTYYADNFSRFETEEQRAARVQRRSEEEAAVTAFFSVVEPLHISDAERLFGTASQAFMKLWFAWVNIIANRCSTKLYKLTPYSWWKEGPEAS
jgi:hypothetical protein